MCLLPVVCFTTVIMPSKEATTLELLQWVRKYARANNNDEANAAAAAAERLGSAFRLNGGRLYRLEVQALKHFVPPKDLAIWILLHVAWREGIDGN